MHKLLVRQLNKLALSLKTAPTAEQWALLLTRIDQSYESADQDRYTLEGSLNISSDELKALYIKQKQSLKEREESILNAMPDLLFLIDEDGLYVDILANEDPKLLFDSKQFLIGKYIHDVLPKALADQFITAIKQAIKTNLLQKLSYQLEVKKGMVSFEGRVVATGQQENNKNTVLFLARDISDIVAAEKKLEFQATHDALTGLPNRLFFDQQFERAIERAKRSNNQGALLFLDLDNFKSVNDSLGHSVGDELLIEIARRLNSLCRAVDTIARFGGDEFVILLEDIGNRDHLMSFLHKLQQKFEKKIKLQGYALDVSTSIGVTLYPEQGSNCEQLIKQADTAMYAAKKSGKNCFHMFVPELLETTVAGFTLDIELHQALEKVEFYMVYQPQYSLPNKEVIGFEALIRWQHPQKGLISPAQFIPAAEGTGFIVKIGLWVFKAICEQVVLWSEAQLPFKRVAFNLSRRQLADRGLYSDLLAILNDTGAIQFIDKIECEMTESAIFIDADNAHHNLVSLSELGMRLSIDDFGTGHSSLINLKRFPLSRLKIDQTFVADVGKDSNDEAIIEVSITLANSFNLEVVAEGVETIEQEQFLKSVQCQGVQGFLYSVPLTVEEAERLLLSTIIKL